jgi:hypothetical protein
LPYLYHTGIWWDMNTVDARWKYGKISKTYNSL